MQQVFVRSSFQLVFEFGCFMIAITTETFAILSFSVLIGYVDFQ